MKESLRLRPLRVMKNNNQKRKKEKPKSKAASLKKPTSTKKTKITPIESSSDSDEAPVGKLKKLEVRVDEDLDAHLPSRRLLAWRQGQRPKVRIHLLVNVHAHVCFRLPGPHPISIPMAQDVC